MCAGQHCKFDIEPHGNPSKIRISPISQVKKLGSEKFNDLFKAAQSASKLQSWGLTPRSGLGLLYIMLPLIHYEWNFELGLQLLRRDRTESSVY